MSACPLLLFISGATTVVFCKIQIKTKSKIQKSIPIGTQPDHKELAPNQLHWQDQSPHVQSLGWLGKTIHGLVIHSPKNTSSFIKMLNIFTFQSRCLRHLDSPFFFPMDLDAYWILSVFQLRKTLAGHTHTHNFFFQLGCNEINQHPLGYGPHESSSNVWRGKGMIRSDAFSDWLHCM